VVGAVLGAVLGTAGAADQDVGGQGGVRGHGGQVYGRTAGRVRRANESVTSGTAKGRALISVGAPGLCRQGRQTETGLS
jgi:hypothetical protein